VLRRLSEYSCRSSSSLLPSILSGPVLTPYSRQLIPVSQPSAIPTEVSEQPTNDAEYARLFNERFATIRKEPARPSSAGGDAEEDETAWLEQALGGQGEDEVDQIQPTKGGLTIQFGTR
jgi:hypothetical protein